MQIFTMVFQLILAIVLLVAAASKVLAWRGWTDGLLNYRIPILRSSVVVWGVPTTETVVGIALIAGVQPFAGLSAAGLFGVFASVLIVALRRGATGRCDCFGELLQTDLGAAAVVRALVLATAGLLCLYASGPSVLDVSARSVIVIGAALTALLYGSWRHLQRLA